MSKESSYFNINNLNGKHDLKKIKKQLDSLSGVMSVSVNEKENKVAVDYDNSGVSSQQIESCLNKMGFEISGINVEEHIM